MSIHTSCPGCGKNLVAPEAHRGKQGNCPACGMTVVIEPSKGDSHPAIPMPPIAEQRLPPVSPSRTPSAAELSAEPRVLPVDPASLPTETTPGADLPESADYANRGSLHSALASWKQHFPACNSAYQPSGKLPAMAMLWLLAGTGLGVPAGALAGTIAAGVGALICGLLGALTGALASCTSRIFCLPVAVLAICALGTLLLQNVVAGVVAGMTVAGMGTLGKNRSAAVPAMLSLIAAPLAVLLMQRSIGWILELLIGTEVFGKDVNKALADATGNATVTAVLTVIGCVVAAASACVMAYGAVGEQKFCELCEEYMTSEDLPGTNFEGLRVLSAALAQSKIEVAGQAYRMLKGTASNSKLFSCRKCQCGYLEVQAHFHGKYTDKENKTQEVNEVWCIASRALEPPETKFLVACAQESPT